MISSVTTLSPISLNRKPISMFLLSMAYIVGIIAIGYQVFPALVYGTALHLLFSYLMIVWNQEKDRDKLITFSVIAYLIGFGAEWAGTSTGYIFGDYAYGDTLGPKLFHTPLIIGVNWALLVVAIGTKVNDYLPKINTWKKGFIGATFMTGLDVLIEPVATHLNMWSWRGNAVPFQNYLGWFVISYVLFFIFFKMKISSKNPIAGLALFLIFLFFLVLNIQLDWSVDMLVFDFSFSR